MCVCLCECVCERECVRGGGGGGGGREGWSGGGGVRGRECVWLCVSPCKVKHRTCFVKIHSHMCTCMSILSCA